MLAEEMVAEGSTGSIVTLICDPGERYLSTYYNADWIAREGLDPRPYRDWLERFSGYAPEPGSLDNRSLTSAARQS